MKNIDLSILVLTIPNRISTFFLRLLNSLEEQSKDYDNIEILCLYDNRVKTVGEKRNILLEAASGRFLVFIDDDDRISNDYVESIMGAIQNNPSADCIVFDCITTIDNDRVQYCKYSIEYDYTEWDDQWRGKPAHTMVWRSDIAKKCKYISTNYGEDIDWVKRACINVKQEVRIDKVLYFYDFNSNVTATRGNL